jgi:hypothetical protein
MSKDPNRLHESAVETLSKSPLVGVLVMRTDQGPIDLAINRNAAKLLLIELQEFLSGNR